MAGLCGREPVAGQSPEAERQRAWARVVLTSESEPASGCVGIRVSQSQFVLALIACGPDT